MEHLVFNSEDELEYKIITSENSKGLTQYTLHASQSKVWTDRMKGQPIISLTDTGNEYLIDRKIDKKLGYDTAFELLVLLKFLNATTNLGGNYKVINPINITTL